MLYNSSGKPIRELKPIIDEMLEKNIPYKLVSKKDDPGFGSYHRDFSKVTVTSKHTGKESTAVLIDNCEIHVGDYVPDRFKPIIAAHEYGHEQGLTHEEIWNLELAMANHLSKTNSDQVLKEDYIRWSSSNEYFEGVRNNAGLQSIQERRDLPETKYEYFKKLFGAEIVLKRKDGEKGFVKVY
ncbi:MAG: hypothetical protein ABIA21_00590 [Candidatus Aenigmatarchaeota archaeon]